MSRLEQETACINGFRPASALAVNHMAKVKSSKIAQYVCAIRLRNLEIGTQFRDSENALRNLEIAQIPEHILQDTTISNVAIFDQEAQGPSTSSATMSYDETQRPHAVRMFLRVRID